ncbi:MAG: ATP-dependent helicase, partial [Clostridia bacterium]|nr:ATP-dependent helicase [Clostridia bacterium]
MERVPNAEQRQVIEDLENNLIVFASAGTGKTFTVAKRVENIIRLQRALPERILCLTFTAKACGEMREALVRYVGEQAKKVEIRTIHGFCYRLMQEESRLSGGNYSEATVCDEEDEEDLLLSILSSQFAFWENGVLPKENEDGEGLTNTAFRIYEKRGGLRTFITALKHAREELRLYTENEEEDYQKSFEFLRARRQKIYEEILSYRTRSGVQVRDEAFERGMTKFAGKFASAYENHLRQSNRVDYDDLIVFANKRLRDEEAGKRWANRYAYIVVDEMQDTSLTEYSVLKGLFGKNRVMMCGDFFQSIYGWRGANPQFVLQDFIENYHAKAYAFSENYRSTQTLANATFEYLKESYPQSMGKYFPKNLRVNNGETGEKILCCGFDNRQEEARQIYEYIKKKGWQNGGNMCVMARSNGYIKVLAQSFEDINAAYPIEERISFYTAEEHLNFYKKPVVKDVLAIFRLLLNGTDSLSAERIDRKYVSLVGEKTIEQLRL